jgi:hypothetical protein
MSKRELRRGSGHGLAYPPIGVQNSTSVLALILLVEVARLAAECPAVEVEYRGNILYENAGGSEPHRNDLRSLRNS